MAHRIIIASLFVSLLISSNSFAQSWMKGSIKGEGNIVKQDITLEPLKGIDLGFDGDVVLTPGSSQKITLEGQQNILDNIKREVKNGIWHITFDKNVVDAKNLTVYITLPGFEEIGLTGSGNISSSGKFDGLKELKINLSGSGDIKLDYGAQSTDLHLSGSGGIRLSGSCKDLDIAISGSGNVNASDLATDDCEIHISGSGDASVLANKNLETHISGSGDVSYTGSASVTSRISGSGAVRKIR